MAWQDLILTAGSVIFVIALLPSVLSKNKPAATTSFLNGSVLVAFTIVYFTLHLWFTTALTAITCMLWYILAFQVIMKKNK